MGLPEGTVLSDLKRKAVSQQIQTVKAEGATRSKQSGEISPFQSAAKTMQQRGKPEEILSKARDADYHDRVSRRTFCLNESQPLSNCPVNLAVLTNQAAIQIVERPAGDATEVKRAQDS